MNESILQSDAVALADFVASGARRLLSTDLRSIVNSSSGQVPVLGGTSSYEIPKYENTFLTHSVLEIKVNLMTSTGGTYRRLADGAAFKFIREMSLSVGGTKIDTLYPKQMEELLFQHSWSEQLDLKKRQLGYLTSTQRNTASAGIQTFYIDLSRYFDFLARPLPLFALDEKLRVEVNWQAEKSVFIETDGTNPVFSFVSASLIITQAVPNGSNQAVSKEVLYETTGANQEGFQIAYASPQRHFEAWGGGSNVNQLTISAFSTYLIIYMNISDGLQNAPADYSGKAADIALDSFALEAPGNRKLGDVDFDVTDTYFKGVLIREYGFIGAKALMDMNIYSISYTDDLALAFDEGRTQYLGSKDMRGIGSATLRLKYPTAPASAGRVVTVNYWVPKKYVIRHGRLLQVVV